MKFHTDHHFVIGQLHVSAGKPCQDHAISGLYQPVPGMITGAYAVVSDGCSSGGHTDIGSRLITMSTLQAMRNFGPKIEVREDSPETIARVTKILSGATASCLGLGITDMLATHLFALVDSEGHAFTSVHGDGAVAVIYREGEMTLSVFEWNRNMPFYPHQDKGAFIEAHGGFDSPSLLQTDYLFTPNGDLASTQEFTSGAEAGTNGASCFLNVLESRISLICLFSDGIVQVDKVPSLDVVRSLTAFKSLAGEFAKRRLMRFVKNSREAGTGPLDDLSMAVIAIEHETEYWLPLTRT